MRYVEQNLMPGEGIRYRTHLHWSTGGTRETFDNISQPLEFRKQVQAYVAG